MADNFIPILMYHEVASRPHPKFRKWTVTPAELRAQMAWLASKKYQSITPDNLRNARQGWEALPDRPFMITFDDGLRGSMEYGPPMLQEFGFTATFYMVAGLVGGTSRWLLAKLGIELPMGDWRDARALLEHGHICGSHALTHTRLALVKSEWCRRELMTAREVLEQELCAPVHHLAYPFGSYNARVRAIAEQCGYYTACSTRPGLSGPRDDLLALRRITVSGGESLRAFVTRVRFGHTSSEVLRAGFARAKRRLRAARRWAWR